MDNKEWTIQRNW